MRSEFPDLEIGHSIAAASAAERVPPTREFSTLPGVNTLQESESGTRLAIG
jgi:hypothetical protein